MAVSGPAEIADGAAGAVAETIRSRIRRLELHPGEPIRQQDMAAELGVSRVPVREALGMLAAEGILDHDRHRGYSVAKLTTSELEQIYFMRRPLETALLRDIRWPDTELLRSLRALNDEIQHAAERTDVGTFIELNRRFHDTIFELSTLRLIHREVRRLWAMAAAYQAMYVYGPDRHRIVSEHREILDALERQDREALVAAIDAHRMGAHDDVGAMLGAR